MDGLLLTDFITGSTLTFFVTNLQNRNTGWGCRCCWRTICSGGCSILWGKSKKAIGWYQGGSVSRWFTIKQSYKCKDSNNDYVAQPQVNGVSAGIAPSLNAAASVTMNFKYKAVVGSGDECRIYYCRAYVQRGSSIASYDFTCAQGVGKGSVGTTSTTRSIPSNSANILYSSYWVAMGSASLSQSTLKTDVLNENQKQRINGTDTKHQEKEHSVSVLIRECQN